LVQVTVSPTETVNDDGDKAKPLIETLFPGGGGLELVDLLPPQPQAVIPAASAVTIKIEWIILLICTAPCNGFSLFDGIT
jgi:hypothetical protein